MYRLLPDIQYNGNDNTQNDREFLLDLISDIRRCVNEVNLLIKEEFDQGKIDKSAGNSVILVNCWNESDNATQIEINQPVT